MSGQTSSSHLTRRMQDGSTVRGTPEAIALAIDIEASMGEQRRQWIAALRNQGVKAAHPDDGWVDRERNTVSLEYPQFNDGLAAGDLLALGAPYSDTRIVRVGELFCISEMFGLWRWSFEEVATVPRPGTEVPTRWLRLKKWVRRG